jgi:type IV secretory pathway component VirB8
VRAQWQNQDKRPVTLKELLVSSLAQTDALAKLLIEKGIITREEFTQKISEERATYQKLLNPTLQ